MEEPVVGLLSEVKNALSACGVALPDKDSGLSRWAPLPSELPEGFASAVDTFKSRLQSEPGALLEASRKVHALFNPFEVTVEKVQNTYTVGCLDVALSGAAQPAVHEIVGLQFRIGKAQLSRLVDDVSNPHREVEEVSASSGAAQASNGKSGAMCVEWSFTPLAVGLRDAGRDLESAHAQHRLVFFSRCTQTFADAAEKIAFFVKSDCERVFSSSGTPDQRSGHFERLTEMVGRYRNAVALYTQRLDAFASQTPEMANGVQPSDAEVRDSDIRINGEIQDILRPELNPRESFGRG